MDDSNALFEALRQAAEPEAAHALEQLIARGSDEELAHVNALSLAQTRGLSEDAVIAGMNARN